MKTLARPGQRASGHDCGFADVADRLISPGVDPGRAGFGAARKS